MGGGPMAECRRPQPHSREHTFRCSPEFQLPPGTIFPRTRFRMPARLAALQLAAHQTSHSTAPPLRPEQAEIALAVSPLLSSNCVPQLLKNCIHLRCLFLSGVNDRQDNASPDHPSAPAI